jgi:maltose alpha-D-glucosyltransferase/alpha-amylase
MDPVYGYHAINVEAQARNISSLLSWTKRMIAVRRTSKVFGRGSLSFIRPPNRSVLAYIREYDGEAILCVANLSRSAQAVELDLAAWKGRVPVEMVGRARFGAIDDRPYSITLAPYGFFWLQLTAPSEGATNQIAQVPEWITLVLADGLKSLTEGRTRTMFERDVLPPFLASRRWFAHKDSRRLQTSVHGVISLTNDDSALIAMVDVHADDETARYALPVTVEWTRFDRAAPEDKASLIASVRRTNREGVLVEAVADRNFVAAIASNIHAGRDIGAEDRRIQCRPSKRFAADPMPAIETVRSLRTDQSNSTVLADDVRAGRVAAFPGVATLVCP